MDPFLAFPSFPRRWWVYLPSLLAASPLGEAVRWDHTGWQPCNFLILSEWWRKLWGVKQCHCYPRAVGFDFLGQLAERLNAVRMEGWEQALYILTKPKSFYGSLCFLPTKARTSRNNQWKGELLLLLLPAWMLRMVRAGVEYTRRRETLDSVLV